MKHSGQVSEFQVTAPILGSLYGLLLAAPALGQQPSFESLLVHPPMTIDATFEKEMFSESVPEPARKQGFAVKVNADDYLLRVLADGSPTGIYGGRFRGTRWEMHAGQLTMSDPGLNQSGSPLDGVELVTRMTANMVVNMGLFELAPRSSIWDVSQHRLVGQTMDGQQLVVHFTYEAELPKEATIREGTSDYAIGSITYHYVPDFHEGRLPVEFTRFVPADAKREKTKLFTVRIQKLEFSDDPPASDEMNPRVALSPGLKIAAMYSNSVLHLVDNSGKIARAQTAGEVNEQVAKMQGKRGRHSGSFVRICLFLMVFGAPVLCLLVYLKQKTKKHCTIHE